MIVNAGSCIGDIKKKELFVIQRCWFSGPQLDPPVDYLRLFETRRDAEEIAYHSAHTYAAAYVKERGSNTHAITVRTILLPPAPNSISSNSGGGSTYAFQTCGKLFWVRSVVVEWVGENNNSNSNSNSNNGSPLTQTVSFSLLSSNMYCCKAVFTAGVIGGTGNPNSRRGVEATEGRVFLGLNESLAPQQWTSTNIVHQMACHVATQVQATLPQHVKVTVQSVMIGKPPENSFNHDGRHNYNLQDWPVQIGYSTEQEQLLLSTALKKRDLNLQASMNNNDNTGNIFGGGEDAASSKKRFRLEYHPQNFPQQHQNHNQQQQQQQEDDNNNIMMM